MNTKLLSGVGEELLHFVGSSAERHRESVLDGD
jgi:hypothetical protein